MGLRSFSSGKHEKAQRRASLENPPPVFHKHGQDELLKAHKHGVTNNKVAPSPNPAASGGMGGLGGTPPMPPNITTSTQLWVAASNAAAAKTRRLSLTSEASYFEEVLEESEYYEEEVVDDGHIDDSSSFLPADHGLPPRKVTIRFDEYDEMQTVLHINDYTKHEISRTWYKREDYDKMVALARKTAEKVEERAKELGNLNKMSSKKKSRQIESRGLEAWTTMGATKVKLLKETAVEVVWNEQSRQWDAGIHDSDSLRESYQTVSKGAQATAQDRGFTDALIAKRIREMEELAKEKKRNRKLLSKTKHAVGKTVKNTAGGMAKTAKLAGKATKMTGKVALKTGKVATKTAVATATLDRKMLKEAIIPSKKKRQCESQIIRRPSQSAIKSLEEFDGGKLYMCVFVFVFVCIRICVREPFFLCLSEVFCC